MRQPILTAVILAAPAVILAAEFTPPGPEERLKAIGPLEGLDEKLRRALDPGDDFRPIPAPKPGDWLAAHLEAGQTFEDFRFSKLRWARPTPARRKICLLPLGSFPEDVSPSLDVLREITAAFFGLETVVLAKEEIEGKGFTVRQNAQTSKRQFLTGDILDFLKKRLRSDAFCIIAVTMEDLYPDPSWNFVFGQAMLGGRRGIYSFARLDPAFHGLRPGVEVRRKTILRRSAGVLVHEGSHLFGMEHCIHYSCILNGSNSLPESDTQPLTLCPVCLRKLQSVVGFDCVERYRKLLDLYRKHGIEEAAWIERRLGHITGVKEGKRKTP